MDLYLHSPITPSWRGAQLKRKRKEIGLLSRLSNSGFLHVFDNWKRDVEQMAYREVYRIHFMEDSSFHAYCLISFCVNFNILLAVAVTAPLNVAFTTVLT
jgi:hypothetical protein